MLTKTYLYTLCEGLGQSRKPYVSHSSRSVFLVILMCTAGNTRHFCVLENQF